MGSFKKFRDSSFDNIHTFPLTSTVLLFDWAVAEIKVSGPILMSDRSHDSLDRQFFNPRDLYDAETHFTDIDIVHMLLMLALVSLTLALVSRTLALISLTLGLSVRGRLL